MTAFLYGLTVIIWGLTWYAIKLQLGPVPIEASIVYRFTIAAVCLLVALVALGRLQRSDFRASRPFGRPLPPLPTDSPLAAARTLACRHACPQSYPS